MSISTLSDQAIESELGKRFRSLRLRHNLTQQALAERVQLSLNSIKALEAGRGKISTIIMVLRELDALDGLDHFIPEITISPLQLARAKGHQRERASGKRGKPSENENEW
ncbi:MAG: helix-turn-helix domain-containing protein [Gammaproteobacteria bacterium]|nr:helix-turn-helix domain-containing protein [Gammaproteobacteria bacterium]